MERLVVRPARARPFAAALLTVLCAVGASPANAQRSDAHHSSGARLASHGGPSASAGFAVRGAVSGDDIVRAARRYIGVRYRLGADSPRALDCSSFVRRVFAEYGVVLPRTAHEQAAIGEAPSPGDLRAGDLLFFYGGHGAQHIAIYVGADTIIHASSRGRRVQLDRLGGYGRRRSWFNERLIAVRRVAPVEGVFRLDGISASPMPARRPTSVDVAAAERTPPRLITKASPKS